MSDKLNNHSTSDPVTVYKMSFTADGFFKRSNVNLMFIRPCIIAIVDE